MIVTPADDRNLDKVLKLIGKAPDEVTLDLDWASAKEKDQRRKEIERERGPRGRPERKEHRGRGRPDGSPARTGGTTARRPHRGGRGARPCVERRGGMADEWVDRDERPQVPCRRDEHAGPIDVAGERRERSVRSGNAANLRHG
jgi:hypothetical protein